MLLARLESPKQLVFVRCGRVWVVARPLKRQIFSADKWPLVNPMIILSLWCATELFEAETRSQCRSST